MKFNKKELVSAIFHDEAFDYSRTIAPIRDKLINITLYTVSILGLPALAASLWRVRTLGWLPIMSLHVAAYCAALAAALLHKRLSIDAKTYLMAAICYVLGASALLSFGLTSSGVVFLVLFCFVVTLLVGRKAGAGALLVSVITILAIGEAVSTGSVVLSFDANVYGKARSTWFVMATGFVLVAAFVILSSRFLMEAVHRYSRDVEESERRYRTLFEVACDAILVMRDDRFVDCNARTLELFGCTREQIIGKFPADFSPQLQPDGRDSREKALETINAALAGHPQYFDWSYIKADGTPFQVEVGLNRVELSSGTYLLALVRDVTERKCADEALAREKAFTDLVIDSLPGVFYICDEDGRLIRWNNNEKEVTGYSPQELMQMNVLNLFQRDRELIAARMREVLEAGRASVEASIVTKSGESIPFLLTGFRMVSDGRRYIVGVGIDISERKHLEQQLRQSHKMEAIGLLAGGVAHDFNNILTAIIGYGSLAKMSLGAEDPVLTYVDQILLSSERAASLTNGLLAFSRKQIMHRKPVNVNEIIAGIGKLLGRIIGEDIDLKTDLAKPDLTVLVDTGQVEQILMNLATNARDAMHGGGSLTIRTEPAEIDLEFVFQHGYGKQGAYALLTVADTGSGMDKATQARIFEPFFTTKELGKGTGLGLSMVYGIVKQHEGFITVDSEPGRGTTFRIYLPLALSPAADAAAARPVKARGGTETVLVAEDDHAVRNLITALLTEAGYEVLSVPDGGQAVTAFREQGGRVRLLLFDLIMPKKGGKEAYEEIRKLRPDIKALFMSGYAADIIQEKSSTGQGPNLILKPILPTELLSRVRETLDR